MPEPTPMTFAEGVEDLTMDHFVYGGNMVIVSAEEAERLIVLGALSFRPIAGPQRILRMGEQWYAQK